MLIQGNRPFQQGNPFQPMQTQPVQLQQPVKPPEPNENQLPRFLNYYADYSGCGHWRMIWPEQVMNAHSKACVHGTTVMNLDERYYVQTKGVRI